MLNLGKIATPVLFAAPANGAMEVAAYKPIGSDDVVVSGANITPYSPVSGDPMQPISSKRTRLSQKEVSQLVAVGDCPSCGSHLVANAALADQLEVAGTQGEHFHCPVCASKVEAKVDFAALTKALAAEFSGDDDSNEEEEDIAEDDMEDGDEGGDDASGYSDDLPDDDEDDDFVPDDEPEVADDDMDEDEMDEGPEVEDTDEDGDVDEDDFVNSDADEDGDVDEDDMEDDDGDNGEVAQLRNYIKKRHKKKSLAADETVDPSDDDSSDGVLVDDDDNVGLTDGEVAAEIKRRRALAADDDSDSEAGDMDGDGDTDSEAGDMDGDDVIDENFVPDDEDGDVADSDADDDSYSEEEVVAALGALIRRRKKQRMRSTASRNVVAGKARPSEKAAAAIAAAKDRFENSGRRQVPGNRKIMSTAEELDDTMILNPQDAINDPAAERLDNKTPGTEDDTIPADNLVDWESAAINIVSIAGDDKWVFVNGKPIGRLVKAKASDSVVAQWDGPVLESAFKAAASRGLMAEEAAEFGLVAHKYKINGSKHVRNVIRRSQAIASHKAGAIVNANVKRMEQSFNTALVAVAKGVFPEHKNPIRDVLVVELSKLGVGDAQSIVDRAFAENANKFVAGITKLAGSLASKSDDARNETATIVANAAYQSRGVDEAAALSDSLVRGSKTALAAAHVTEEERRSREVAAEKDNTVVSIRDKVRLALRR